MADDQAPATPETAVASGTESTATPQATDSVPEAAKEQTPQPVVEDSPEQLRKKLEQIEMERNLLRNKNAEFERAQEEARRAEMTELDRLREERDSIQQEKERLEAKQMRDDFIADYPDENVKAAARKLLSKNEAAFVWGDVATSEEAKAAIFSQLDAIKEVISPEGGAPSVHPNNPAPTAEPAVTREQLVAEAVKTGDFSKVIQSIPSVETAIKSMKGEV